MLSKKVDIPNPWVNSLVIVQKRDGSSRLCLHPRDLNKAIRREHHRILTVEDIASRLSGKKVFSIVDEKDGFWQVPLDDESSYLCKFNTPYGRYCFNECPSALSPPQRSFRRGINPYLEKLTVWKSSSMTSLLLLQMSKNMTKSWSNCCKGPERETSSSIQQSFSTKPVKPSTWETSYLNQG